MTTRQRRAVTQTAWRLLVLAVITLAGGWDATGLLVGGNAAYTSPSYDVLRLAPWGMRTYGPPLVALLVVTVYAYGRHTAGLGLKGYTLLRYCLSVLAGWYVLWAVAIAGAWVIHAEVYAWEALGKLVLTAAVCLTLARTTPTDNVGR